MQPVRPLQVPRPQVRGLVLERRVGPHQPQRQRRLHGQHYQQRPGARSAHSSGRGPAAATSAGPIRPPGATGALTSARTSRLRADARHRPSAPPVPRSSRESSPAANAGAHPSPVIAPSLIGRSCPLRGAPGRPQPPPHTHRTVGHTCRGETPMGPPHTKPTGHRSAAEGHLPKFLQAIVGLQPGRGYADCRQSMMLMRMRELRLGSRSSIVMTQIASMSRRRGGTRRMPPGC